tara:strand:+ start:180 stop:1694 length:1515 start_codon:yes stop_codon:yes gene_type:complete
MAEEVKVNLKAEFGSLRRDLQDVTTELVDIKDESKKASKGLGGIKKAVTGVGAVLTGGLFKAGAVIFEKLMELFMGNQRVMDAMAVGANMLQKAFNDLIGFVTNFSIPSLTELKDIVIQGVIDRFNQAVEAVGFLGKAISSLMSGNVVGALDNLKKAGKESFDIFTGVDNTLEKTTEAVSNYAKETFNAAKNQVDLNKQAQLAEAINAKLLLQFSQEAELQRQIRDDTSRSIEDRIAANEELGRVLDRQAEVMMANAQDQVDAAQAALDLDKENLDLQIALINAQTALIDVEETVTGFRSEQLTNTNSLLQEQKDLQDEILEGEKELAEEAQKIKDDAKAKNDAIKAAEEKAAVDQDNATLGRLANLAGEGTRIGKAMAVADVTRETVKGVQSAFTTAQSSPLTVLFPPYPFIQAGIAAAFGAKSIQSIISGSKPSASSGGGGSAPAPASAPPDFNIVGASPINQLAETIGDDRQKPIKAFVTSGDVSTAQSLDRNIIENASIG